MTDPVKRAEELLAGITEGDMKATGNAVHKNRRCVLTVHTEPYEQRVVDAAFFASAPSLVRELIARDKEREAEVKALREERERLQRLGDQFAWMESDGNYQRTEA